MLLFIASSSTCCTGALWSFLSAEESLIILWYYQSKLLVRTMYDMYCSWSLHLYQHVALELFEVFLSVEESLIMILLKQTFG